MIISTSNHAYSGLISKVFFENRNLCFWGRKKFDLQSALLSDNHWATRDTKYFTWWCCLAFWFLINERWIWLQENEFDYRSRWEYDYRRMILITGAGEEEEMWRKLKRRRSPTATISEIWGYNCFFKLFFVTVLITPPFNGNGNPNLTFQIFPHLILPRVAGIWNCPHDLPRLTETTTPSALLCRVCAEKRKLPSPSFSKKPPLKSPRDLSLSEWHLRVQKGVLDKVF